MTDPVDLSCARCGDPIVKKPGRGRLPKFCPRHRSTTAKRYHENPAFRTAHLAATKAAYKPSRSATARSCATCGTEYQPLTRHGTNRFCSRACRDRSDLARQRARAKDRVRRAARRAGRPYRDADIFERDGWRCGLCHRTIDQGVRYPDPMSASVDHIVPLSKGGVDAPENVQAAHLRCNVSKGNRGGGEQFALALVG